MCDCDWARGSDTLVSALPCFLISFLPSFLPCCVPVPSPPHISLKREFRNSRSCSSLGARGGGEGPHPSINNFNSLPPITTSVRLTFSASSLGPICPLSSSIQHKKEPPPLPPHSHYNHITLFIYLYIYICEILCMCVYIYRY